VALTDRQRLFVAEYLVDLNATQAAIRAGYSPRTARQQGNRLLTHVDVQPAIIAAQAERAQRVAAQVQQVESLADRVLREVSLIAFSDIGDVVEFTADGPRMRPMHEIPESARRTISNLEVRQEHGTEDRPGATCVKFKQWSKDANLAKLMQHLGLLVEKHEHSGEVRLKISAEELSDDELAGIARPEPS
jgi:phage terminase small subunit